jgi:hypothetical protein
MPKLKASFQTDSITSFTSSFCSGLAKTFGQKQNQKDGSELFASA